MLALKPITNHMTNTIKVLIPGIMALLATSAPVTADAGVRENAATAAINNYLPGTTGFGPVEAKKVTVNTSKKTIVVDYNGNACYVPLDAAKIEAIKNDIRKSLGANYSKYKVRLMSGKSDLDKLALFAPKKNIGPTEKKPFVVRDQPWKAPAGLDGANIALWQSHGWYFEPKLNRWEWQRARIFQTVEDLYPQAYVMPFLMPMLENAGAYVMSPRERDVNTVELIIDNDISQFTEGNFISEGEISSVPGFGYTKKVLHVGDNPFKEGSAIVVPTVQGDEPNAIQRWNASIPADGTYAVYVSYQSLPNSSENARYCIYTQEGKRYVTVNQRMGGGTWIYLGHYPLAKCNERTIVELYNNDKAKGTVVSADAVKIGGGMGNVARIVKEPLDSIDYEYVLSGYPRFTEGARYFLQWAGAPDSVYTKTENVNDYTDDYCSRGLWVNWLAGGSSMLPGQKGLNIPVDLSFAFHTDAGTTLNDSIIGTLGIYCTQGETLGNGSTRLASRDLTDIIMTNIVDDVRAQFEPNWTRRGMWDRSYHEARSPQVPAMLLEFLSHQNFADMSYGLDPAFRFTVSRAIYKGMLKYIAQRDGRPYVVQPLPVRAFAISDAGDKWRLTWKPTDDPAEPTAAPTYYIIEERSADRGFRVVGRSEKPEFELEKLKFGYISSFRIIACNDGGASFPSEVLACGRKPGSDKTLTIVNGFTRISAPDRFDAGKDSTEIAGFYTARDGGVPYVQDISFIGEQFEFRRQIPWMDDDAAGFGASRANYETKVIAGNTFDYTEDHGFYAMAAGWSFVSTSVEAFCESTDTPQAVDLILGKQKETKTGTGAYGTRYKAFPTALQTRMADLAAKGTGFFVSGSYVATDIWDNPYSSAETAEADKKFAREILGFNWRVGQASVTGQAYEVPCRFKEFGKGTYDFYNEYNSDFYAIESPDSFYPADKATGATFMRYSENNLVAGTVFSAPTHKAVVIGFPFETIKGDGMAKLNLMNQILKFLENK